MSGAAVATWIGAAAAAAGALGNLYTSHQQQKAQKEAANIQAEGQRKANELQEQQIAQNEQSANKAAMEQARPIEDSYDSNGFGNLTGGQGIAGTQLALGKSSLLGGDLTDEQNQSLF